MRSFVFWLTSAAALGAILAMIVHPGAAEVLIVWAVVNALFYGLRGRARRQQAPV